MGGFNLAIGFFSTLLATLIGVIVGFWNDRMTDEIKSYARAIQHLNSVNTELERNRETINHSVDVISDLQEDGGGETSHYAIDLLSVDAWRAAVQDGLVDAVDSDLYQELNEIYYRTKAVNELIRRLRTESIHPSLGESDEEDLLADEMWTISVTYWNEEADEIREADLATVIKKRCNSLGIRIDGVSDDIDEAIKDLKSNKESTEKKTLKRFD